ncbi:MAG: hypothetical protein ABGW84_08115 [Sphingomonadaceae bacterium]
MREYRTIDAKVAAASAVPAGEETEEEQAKFDELASMHADAIDDLMLLPAPTVGAFIEKIEIFHRNDLADGWWRASEIVAIMACDADRLLRIHHRSRGE